MNTFFRVHFRMFGEMIDHVCTQTESKAMDLHKAYREAGYASWIEKVEPVEDRKAA
jgi:hypothetical protein